MATSLTASLVEVLAFCLVSMTGCAEKPTQHVDVCSCESSGDWFVDVTSSSGVVFSPLRSAGNFEGAGVAVLDLDSDGDLDILIAGDEAGLGVFIGNGDLTFVDESQPHLLGVLGFAATDVDGDGTLDVVLLTRTGPAWLRFVDNSYLSIPLTTTEPSVFATAGAFGDANLDGIPELYVAGGLDRSQQDIEPDDNQLWMRDSQGEWTLQSDVTTQLSGALTLAASWFDVDGDDVPELLVANDLGPMMRGNSLLRLSGENWTDVARDHGLDLSIMAMGIATFDADLDGQFDLYFSNVGANVLAMNHTGVFIDEARSRGAAVASVCDPNRGVVDWPNYDVHSPDKTAAAFAQFYDRYVDSGGTNNPVATSWSAVPFDFDQDGDEDLFVANGAVALDPLIPESRSQQNVLLINDGTGLFVDETSSSGVNHCGDTRGASVGDLDGDGDLDLVVADTNVLGVGSVHVYRNDAAFGNYLSVRLRGSVSTPDGLGAIVKIRAGNTQQTRLVSTQIGFASAKAATVHFGLGDAGLVDEVEVLWPSGLTTTLRNVAVNRELEIIEG